MNEIIVDLIKGHKDLAALTIAAVRDNEDKLTGVQLSVWYNHGKDRSRFYIKDFHKYSVMKAVDFWLDEISK